MTATESERPDEPSSASAESPPPFHSHNFPARYYPDASENPEPYCPLTTTACADALTATAPAGPAPPFEETEDSAAASSVVAETKAALPRDNKDGQSSKDLDDGEPPPPYTEGSSPLEGFTYVMAAAGSIITQVQQGGPAPINTALGGAYICREAIFPVLIIAQAQTRTSHLNYGWLNFGETEHMPSAI